jgi:hypothetical protein
MKEASRHVARAPHHRELLPCALRFIFADENALRGSHARPSSRELAVRIFLCETHQSPLARSLFST